MLIESATHKNMEFDAALSAGKQIRQHIGNPVLRAGLSAARYLRQKLPREIIQAGLGTLGTIIGAPKTFETIAEGAPITGTNGLVAVGGALSPENQLLAYRSAMHQCSHVMPPKWRRYDQRMISCFDQLKVRSETRRRWRKSQCRCTFDTAFEDVIVQCALPRRKYVGLTWLLPDVADNFVAMHAAGRAHSIEIWDKEGNLVAGAFGVAYGRIFIGESTFSLASNAGSFAYILLMRHLQKWGFAFADGGPSLSHHVLSLGAEYVDGDTFARLVADHGQADADIKVGRWAVDQALMADPFAELPLAYDRAALLGTD